ncbi:diguanylate cyclase [Alkalibaculum sp. M08DMB]|uniref:Diguanylate cyclase n=1 Tax=Alkalibaculum sporogenes TaxID=2655001 RepID=A0A6A7K4Z5_9FIRM|nr:GGDEF domain-containing protein [Alkalibaculum sporogenes]MPW24502.1 diguanylate cyclase [Alkalibaculum sporogenes]
MKEHSLVLLITSIIIFISGVIMSIFTIVILDIDILEAFRVYPVLNFVLTIALIALIAFYITMFVRQYRNLYKEKQIKEQMEMVRLDNLTQLYNFDYFINVMKTVEAPFCLVMLDIDNFKEINEKFDSVIGDLVLKVIAKSIKENIRLSDIVARYQGDAFVIILKNCPPKNAITLMELVRTYIKENERLSEKDIKLSTSVGIHYVTKNEPEEVLFRNIVEALCVAKTNDEDHKVVLYSKAHKKEKLMRVQ